MKQKVPFYQGLFIATNPSATKGKVFKLKLRDPRS